MNTKKFFLVVFGLVVLEVRESCQFQEPLDFSTLKGQRVLAQTEQTLISHLTNYTTVLETTILKIRIYMAKYAATILDPLSRRGLLDITNWSWEKLSEMPHIADVVTKDPLMSFQILRRIETDFAQVSRAIDYYEASEDNLKMYLHDQRERVELPTMENVETSKNILVNMFHLYKWTFEDIFQGRLVNVDTRSGLSLEDLFELAVLMAEQNVMTKAINVLGNINMALIAANENTDFARAVNDALTNVVHQHDSVIKILEKENVTIYNPYFFAKQVNVFEPRHLNWPTERIINISGTDDFEAIVTQKGLNLGPLCRGEEITPSVDNLKCFLVSHHHPYWILMPQKFEVRSKDPFIVQVYDVVSEAFIDKFKALMFPELVRSEVITADGSNNNSQIRVSSTVSLHHKDSEKWNRVAELTTGLAASDSETEPLQITNYASGGHYMPHVDALYTTEIIGKAVEDANGDRILTFMFYLSSMEGGGRTAFSFIEKFAEPVKGSALMWYNLYPNMTIDFRTWHSGCPVVLGTKWVATKWIRQNAQMFRRQCAPQRDLDKEKYWFYESFGLAHS